MKLLLSQGFKTRDEPRHGTPMLGRGVLRMSQPDPCQARCGNTLLSPFAFVRNSPPDVLFHDCNLPSHVFGCWCSDVLYLSPALAAKGRVGEVGGWKHLLPLQRRERSYFCWTYLGSYQQALMMSLCTRQTSFGQHMPNTIPIPGQET